MKKFRTSADMSRKVINGNTRPSPELRPRSVNTTNNVVKSNKSKDIDSKPKGEKKPVIKGNDIVIKFD